MAGDLLLVGSIPLDTPEQVFRRVGGPLGPYLAYMPDGEVGDRRYWIDGIAYRVFNGHPEIETLRRPMFADSTCGRLRAWRDLRRRFARRSRVSRACRRQSWKFCHARQRELASDLPLRARR